MRLDLQKVRANVEAATTEDLLDRATVWRYGMEPVALEIIEAELRRRGVNAAELEAHAGSRSGEVLATAGGHVPVCCKCHRPAVERRWVWGKLWWLVPLFPRRAYFCEKHRPGGAAIRPSAPDQRPPA